MLKWGIYQQLRQRLDWTPSMMYQSKLFLVDTPIVILTSSHHRFLRQNSHYKSSLFSIILEQHIGNEDMITLVENDIPTTDKHIISKFNFVHLASEVKLVVFKMTFFFLLTNTLVPEFSIVRFRSSTSCACL